MVANHYIIRVSDIGMLINLDFQNNHLKCIHFKTGIKSCEKLTKCYGIQEVSGSIPLISTKKVTGNIPFPVFLITFWELYDVVVLAVRE